MLGKLYAHLRGSRLLQAGTLCVVLGLVTEALEALGTVDFTALPYVGPHAAAILAGIGLTKIALRLIIGLVASYSAEKEVTS